MAQFVLLPIRETNLLRTRIRLLLRLRSDFLVGRNHNTIHDLRVASRRTREVLDYLQPILPPKWHERLSELARTVTRRLGQAREAEVNAGLISKWNQEKRLDPIVSEFLIHEQMERLRKFRTNAIDRISDKTFIRFDEFLERLRGSHMMIPMEPQMLFRRKEEFLSFSWNGTMNDERLHDLRIRAKKFRYAMEIYDRLHQRNQGRFLLRIKRLQELLGELHDLFVLGEILITKKEEWADSGLLIIPEAVESAHQILQESKMRLYPKVYPMYSGVVQHFPPDFSLALQENIPQVS